MLVVKYSMVSDDTVYNGIMSVHRLLFEYRTKRNDHILHERGPLLVTAIKKKS